MPIDPFAPDPLDQAERTSARIADLERRLVALEHGAPTIQTGTVPPSLPTRDGTPYGEGGATPRLWLRLDGVWMYTDLF